MITGQVLSNYTWFIYAILYLYLAFFISYKITKNDKKAISFISLFIIFYILICDFFSFGTWCYNTIVIFLAGIFFAKYTEQIAFASTLSPIIHEEWGDFKWGADKFRDYVDDGFKGCEKYIALLPKDAEEYSDALFESAMENNDVSLYRKLGHCYLFGLGISQNKDKAAQMYAKAAELGDWDGLMRCIASYHISNQAWDQFVYNEKLRNKAISEGYALNFMSGFLQQLLRVCLKRVHPRIAAEL